MLLFRSCKGTTTWQCYILSSGLHWYRPCLTPNNVASYYPGKNSLCSDPAFVCEHARHIMGPGWVCCFKMRGQRPAVSPCNGPCIACSHDRHMLFCCFTCIPPSCSLCTQLSASSTASHCQFCFSSSNHWVVSRSHVTAKQAAAAGRTALNNFSQT